MKKRRWMAVVLSMTAQARAGDRTDLVVGLQVHGIGKGAGPFMVSWKNIRIKEL